jgi:hypothetical protein
VGLSAAALAVRLPPEACLGVRRSGDGWGAPHISIGIRGLGPAGRLDYGSPELEQAWRTIAAAAPFNARGYPGTRPPGHASDDDEARFDGPLGAVARLLRAVTQPAGPRAVLCLVGDSVSINLLHVFGFAVERLRALQHSEPAAFAALMGRRRLPLLELVRTHLSAGCAGLNARRCERTRTMWRSAIRARGCTSVIAEPASAHAAVASGADLLVLAKLVARAAPPAAGVRWGGLGEAELERLGAWMQQRMRLTAAYRRDLTELVIGLAEWAALGPTDAKVNTPPRLAVVRAPLAQHFPLVGDYTPSAGASNPYKLARVAKLDLAALARGSPFRGARCRCEPLHRAIANATAFAHMSRAIGAAVATAGRGCVAFADTYAATVGAGARAADAHLGCFGIDGANTRWACAAGTRDSASEALRARWFAPPTSEEAALRAAGVDGGCDCTHYGFEPFVVGAIARELAAAAESLLGDTSRRRNKRRRLAARSPAHR